MSGRAPPSDLRWWHDWYQARCYHQNCRSIMADNAQLMWTQWLITRPDWCWKGCGSSGSVVAGPGFLLFLYSVILSLCLCVFLYYFLKWETQSRAGLPPNTQRKGHIYSVTAILALCPTARRSDLPGGGPFLSGVCMFSSVLCGFSPGSPTFSHRLKAWFRD